MGSCLTVRNVADNVSAMDLVRFFEQHPAGSRILECKFLAGSSLQNHSTAYASVIKAVRIWEV
jgi:hypothetical protein